MEKWVSNKSKTIPEGLENIDPYWTELYLKSLSEGTEKQCLTRLMIVGHAGVGKTTLVRNLMTKSIEGIESTNGIDIQVKTVATGSHEHWEETDSAKEETQFIQRIARILQATKTKDSESMTDTAIKTEDSNSSDKKSANDNQRVKETKENTLDIPANNKPTEGLPMKPPFSKTLSPLKKSLSNEYLRKVISMEKQVNNEIPNIISIWDFGGQFIFYATHQLFHSPEAVYVLVLDLSKHLTDIVDFAGNSGVKEQNGRDVRSFILFWVQSIHSFACSKCGQPPVLLVGTHKDSIVGDDDDKEKYADEYFEDVRAIFDGTNLLDHIQPEQFSLDNLKPEESVLQELRNSIMSVAHRELIAEKVIPAKWIPLESALTRTGVNYLSFDQICQIDSINDMSINSVEEIKLFLMYHHYQGILVYFNEQELSNIIILDPQWLIDAFKCVITSRKFCKIRASLRSLWEELESKAILRNDLLYEVWQANETHDFIADKDIILKFLVRLGIICKGQIFHESKEELEDLDYYLVPSLLPMDEKEIVTSTLFSSAKVTDLSVVLLVKESCICPTVYHRTLSGAIGRWPVLEYCGKRLLTGSYGVFSLDVQHVGLIRLTTRALELTVYNLCGEPVNNVYADTFRRFITKVVKQEFRRNKQIETNNFTIAYRCSCCKESTCKLLPLEKLIECDLIPCLNSRIVHNINTIDAYLQWNVEPKDVVKECRSPVQSSINDEQLGLIATAIKSNWKLLGISLGVPVNELDEIQIDHVCFPAVQTRRMLMAWQRHAGKHATFRELIKELELNKAVEVDNDILKDIADLMNDSEKSLRDNDETDVKGNI